MAEEDFEKMALTPFDEYPVHATPYPMSYVPNSDPSWDDGYYFGVYNIDEGLYIVNGMRVAANNNMIGAHSSINARGVQRALRLSRVWRDDFSISVGPLRYEFLEPLRTIRMVLEPNDSGMSYDIVWEGLAPPHLSQHHRAIRNGRRTTDQSRWNQVGVATGWVEIDGNRMEMTKDQPWAAVRDRSWGVYESRPPLAASSAYAPPAEIPATPRALRFSCFLQAGDMSSYFHFHEGPDGEKITLNDAFGTPFEGWINFGWGGSSLRLLGYNHVLNWRQRTRSMTDGVVTLSDEKGGEWKLEMEVNLPPHVLGQIGYHVGAWTDGGTIHTFHGKSPAMEWDEFDFSQQPCEHTFPGTGDTKTVFGVHHLATVKVTSPDGSILTGRALVEIFLNGRYSPYGFSDQKANGGLIGRGVA